MNIQRSLSSLILPALLCCSSMSRAAEVPAPSIDSGATETKSIVTKNKKVPRLRVWVGMGFNYLKHDQKREASNLNLVYETFKMPSSYIEAQAAVYGPFGLALSWKKSPGSITNGSSYTVVNNDYFWTMQALEITFSPENWKGRFLGFNSRFSLRAGGNSHSVPMVVRLKATEYGIKNSDVPMASAGGQLLLASQRWRFETFLRYQHPFSPEGLVMKNPASFDGSLGFYRVIAKNYMIGGFWYGQALQFDFTGKEDYQNAIISGKQFLLYSNVDLRFGMQF